MHIDSKKYVLDEAMQNLLHWSAVYTPVDQSMAAMRDAYDRMCIHYTPERDDKVKIQDHTIAHAEYPIPIRLYYPNQSVQPENGWDCILYLHGGGYVVGGLDSHEFFTRRLCEDLNVAVISVDYRLAPEHHFPAAFLDCKHAYDWLKQNAQDFQINADQIILAGDSAGGNLATGLAVALQHTGSQAKGLVLIYPGLDSRTDLASYTEYADAPLLSTEDVQYYLKEYAPNPTDWSDLRLAPLQSPDFSDMPETFISVAEYDPLRDDGQALAEKLENAKIPYTYHVVKGLLHGGLRELTTSLEVQKLYQDIQSAVKKMLQV